MRSSENVPGAPTTVPGCARSGEQAARQQSRRPRCCSVRGLLRDASEDQLEQQIYSMIAPDSATRWRSKPRADRWRSKPRAEPVSALSGGFATQAAVLPAWALSRAPRWSGNRAQVPGTGAQVVRNSCPGARNGRPGQAGNRAQVSPENVPRSVRKTQPGPQGRSARADQWPVRWPLGARPSAAGVVISATC